MSSANNPSTSAEVTITADRGTIQVDVCDDGGGGADPEGGSGLRGLTDRVEALGGTLRVVSPKGGGTRVTARLPLPVTADPVAVPSRGATT